MIDPFKLFLPSSEWDESIINTEMKRTNINRSLIVSCCCILFSLTILHYFYQNSNYSSEIERHWKKSVLLLNVCMLFTNALFTAIALYVTRYKKNHSAFYHGLPYAMLMVLGVWGITGTILHQLVSWTIIPFILTSFTAASILIRPKTAFYYFLFLYLIFCFCITLNQNNPGFIALNCVLGLASVFISYSLSAISWNNSMSRFRQNRLIEKQTLELQEANASKDKFFSILSHDLKGPVASSLLLAEVLEENDLGEKERKEVNQLFRESLENISRLLNNVLLWANTQTGNIVFHPIHLDLHESVEETIQLLHMTAVQKKITVHNKIAPGLFLHADQNMTHTILRNLLSNAIKFTHAQGLVEITAEVFAPDTTLPVPYVLLSIIDNGIGMPASMAKNLFRIDQKTILTGTENERGTGLGLILCKDFIEKHHGTIKVESEENKGSRFMIALPLEQA